MYGLIGKIKVLAADFLHDEAHREERAAEVGRHRFYGARVQHRLRRPA